MDNKNETQSPATDTAKYRIALMARKLERSALNTDLEIFYGAVAEEFERQLAFDSSRAKSPSSAPVSSKFDTK